MVSSLGREPTPLRECVLEPRTVASDKDVLATWRDAVITDVAHCVPLAHDGQPWQHSAEHWERMLQAVLDDHTGVN